MGTGRHRQLSAYQQQLLRRRRFRPIAAGMKEQLAFGCDKALHAFGAKL
jgi:hypothetical protein